MGRQPFGLASPAAWLRGAGYEVRCVDLTRTRLPEDTIKRASLVAFYLPMHTATRLALGVMDRVRAVNPAVHRWPMARLTLGPTGPRSGGSRSSRPIGPTFRR